jgi:hypothetical protein
MSKKTEQFRIDSQGTEEIKIEFLDSKKQEIITVLSSINIKDGKINYVNNEKKIKCTFTEENDKFLFNVANEIYMLKKNDDILKKIHNDVEEVFGKNKGKQIDIDFEIEKMKIDNSIIINYLKILFKKINIERLKTKNMMKNLLEIVKKIYNIDDSKLLEENNLKELGKQNKSIEEKMIYISRLCEYLKRLPSERVNNYENVSVIVSILKFLDSDDVKKCVSQNMFDKLKKCIDDLKKNINFCPINILKNYPDLLGKNKYDDYFYYEKIIKPHQHQIDIGQKVFDKKESGFFISYITPTGSGKTMSSIAIAKLVEKFNSNITIEKKYKLIFACNSDIVKNQIATYMVHSGIKHLETKKIKDTSNIISENKREFYFSKYRSLEGRKIFEKTKKENQQKLDKFMRESFGPYFMWNSEVINSLNDNIRKSVNKELIVLYNKILSSNINYFSEQENYHTIITDTNTATEILEDIGKDYNFILFFDEPTIGAETYNSEEMKKNTKLLNNLPLRTILSSATIFEMNNENIIYKNYKENNKLVNDDNLVLISQKIFKNGFIFKSHYDKTYPIYSFLKDQSEIEKLIEKLDEDTGDVFFKKSCSMEVLTMLIEKLSLDDSNYKNELDEWLKKQYNDIKKWNINKIVSDTKNLLGVAIENNDVISKEMFDFDINTNSMEKITKENIIIDDKMGSGGSTLVVTTDINIYDNIFLKISEKKKNILENRKNELKEKKRKVFDKKIDAIKEIGKEIGEEIDYNKLANLLSYGIGVYSYKLNDDYLEIIEDELNNNNIVYLIADDSIIYGSDFIFNALFIDDDFSRIHSIETNIQTIGRTGRDGTCAYIYIPESLMCRFYNYIIKGKDEIYDESFNVKTKFEFNILEKKNKEIIASINKKLGEKNYGRSNFINLFQNNDKIIDKYNKIIDEIKGQINITITNNIEHANKKCGVYYDLKMVVLNEKISLFEKLKKEFMNKRLDEYISLLRKSEGKYNLLLQDYENIKKNPIIDYDKSDVERFNEKYEISGRKKILDTLKERRTKYNLLESQLKKHDVEIMEYEEELKKVFDDISFIHEKKEDSNRKKIKSADRLQTNDRLNILLGRFKFRMKNYSLSDIYNDAMLGINIDKYKEYNNIDDKKDIDRDLLSQFKSVCKSLELKGGNTTNCTDYKNKFKKYEIKKLLIEKSL